MNILMISDVYFPRINGVSTSIATFRRALSEIGHQSSLIAPDYPAEQETGRDIIRVPSRYLFLDPEDRALRAGKILALEKQLRKQRFDLVHIQTPFIAHSAGLTLAHRLGLPVVETCHTHFEEYLFHYVKFLPRTLLRALARNLTRRQCNRVDAVIVPSHAMSKVLTDYNVHKPISIIPTGIESSDFSAGSKMRFCAAHALDSSRPMLVHVGRLAHEKNIGFLLQVLCAVRRHVPRVLLILAGEGPALQPLRNQATRLGLNEHIEFVGYLHRGPDLWDCFCAGDAFVFSSTTETQGLVLLEAMALGVPVVSTAVMGTFDILQAGRGALVAEPTVTDFSSKVVRLLLDPPLRRELASEGRRYAQQWSAVHMAKRLADFYRCRVDAYVPVERFA
jgi:glycosyltransferase involved in cell wall biosynthesis